MSAYAAVFDKNVGGGQSRLPLGKTRNESSDRTSRGRESTREEWLKNEATARAYSTNLYPIVNTEATSQ